MNQFNAHPARTPTGLRLYGRRVVLRPLSPPDFTVWSAVRQRNHDWLTIWEPQRLANMADPSSDREAFGSRCTMRDRERQAGTSYSFGMFTDNTFIGEMNLNMVQRGALMTGTVGYWIDQDFAGKAYTPEGVVVLTRFAFADLGLHRIEICIVPRNHNSHRVMEKLKFREEGMALRFLEIHGVWEDHVRYGFTAEEWAERNEQLAADWL